MGRSYNNTNHDEDRDRRKANKKLKSNKKSRNSRKNLREYTAENLTEDDFFDMEGDDYDGKQSRI